MRVTLYHSARVGGTVFSTDFNDDSAILTSGSRPSKFALQVKREKNILKFPSFCPFISANLIHKT
jgi:hypothetical protein